MFKMLNEKVKLKSYHTVKNMLRKKHTTTQIKLKKNK